MKDLFINILTKADIRDKKWALQIFDITNEICPCLMPQTFGNYEPLNEKIEFHSIDSLGMNFWKNPFLWKCKKPNAEGGVWFSQNALMHNAFTLGIDSKQIKSFPEVINLFKELTVLLKPDLGFCHLLTSSDFQRNEGSKTIFPLGKDEKKTFFCLLPQNKLNCTYQISTE